MSHRHWAHITALPVLAVISAPAWATDYLTVEQAQRALIPQAQTFAVFPVTLNPAQLQQIRRLSGVPQRTNQPRVWRAMRGNTVVGWVIVDEVIGKHEFITYAAGISPDGHVLGVEILSYRESKGGQVRDPNWRGRFRGKTLADPFRLNQDIPNISGATLSSRNITDGVKRLLAIHSVALPHG
ncbi:MAG: FMN-binding protein [Novosphingobium sp.]|uniref:FMN-binding protein n=1 Tax=Novosphingobium sp. TaxID=1874826 RepID=UPI001DAC0D6C|nr:FMN-binding protein [Novosphingobium sp.]MCB2057145.1 FMN-binding protein [Novosphingobium sp.]MCP5385998.1 FMN-binding protein [Novosphingobium sp.]